MPFTSINTQEEFDAAIRDRIARERSKYADYEDLKNQVSALTEEKKTHNTAMSESGKKIKELTDALDAANEKAIVGERKAMKLSAAVSNGLPVSIAERIIGDTEEAINADAQALAQLFGSGRKSPPLAQTEPAIDAKNAAYKKLAASLI